MSCGLLPEFLDGREIAGTRCMAWTHVTLVENLAMAYGVVYSSDVYNHMF